MSLARDNSDRSRNADASLTQMIDSGTIGADYAMATAFEGGQSHGGQGAAMRTDVLALICPDWRVASLVLDGRSGQVTYANTPCLQMLDNRETVHLIGGRIAFVSPRLTERFYVTLDRMLASGLENAALVEREAGGGSLISIMIRNAQGFFRDVLDRSTGRTHASSPLVVVELATSLDQTEWSALRAFGQMFALLPAEVEIVDLIVRGLSVREIAELKRLASPQIRTTLKAVLTKTQCKHQVGLVRLVMTLCPPTRRA